MIHIFVKTLFGFEIKRSVPIDREAFESMMSRHATRSIEVGGIRYYYLIKKYDIHVMRQLQARCQLLGYKILQASNQVVFHSTIEKLESATLDHLMNEVWFKELTLNLRDTGNNDE